MMVFQVKWNFCFTLDDLKFLNNAGASESSLNNKDFGLQENGNVPDIFKNKSTQTDRMRPVQWFTMKEVKKNVICKKVFVRSKAVQHNSIGWDMKDAASSPWKVTPLKQNSPIPSQTFTPQ